jgi:hypothetical protein
MYYYHTIVKIFLTTMRSGFIIVDDIRLSQKLTAAAGLYKS